MLKQIAIVWGTCAWISAALVACGDESLNPNDKNALTDKINSQSEEKQEDLDKLDQPGPQDGDSTASGPAPVMMIPDAAVDRSFKFNAMTNNFISVGHQRQNLYYVPYDFDESIAGIATELTNRMNSIMQLYPPKTKFDIVAHGLGQFMALYALMIGGLDGHVRKFIGLAGGAHGINSHWPYCMICPDFFDLISPQQNQFLLDFYATYNDRINKLSKCSLFSPEDEKIEPYDSGKFSDGVNMQIPDMSHIGVLTEFKYFSVMQQSCGI